MSTPGTEQGHRRNAPTLELLRSLAEDVKVLVLCETELATQEVKAKASEARAGAEMLGAGLLIAFVSVLALTAAAILALAIVLPAWAAATVVGVFLLCLAVGLVLPARARFRRAMPLAPTETIDAAKEDIEWIRTRAGELKTSG